jgi:site-specific recombinase XerD
MPFVDVRAEIVDIRLASRSGAAEHRTPLQRATQYRNGMMIALLACCPIRLKSFAALSLGETLVQIEDCWWIVLTAQQTKEKRPDERRIPDFLGPYLDRYVSEHRKVLAGSNNASTACWLSRSGAPMSYLGVEGTVTRTAAATTGIMVSPHLFRTSAATTAAIHAGTTPHLASALLDHRDTATTQQHYNRASSLTAGKAYLALAQTYRNDI